MPCYRPIQAFRQEGTGDLVFSKQAARTDATVQVPCGRCVGCRIMRSQEWAIRCVHEASLHEDNCFITLTYSDSFLPSGGILRLDDFQRFMKRVRKRYSEKSIRFFHCGEYGPKLGRPHYHALLFGHDWDDKRPHKQERGNVWYRSEQLSSLWGLGHCLSGAITYQSAAYCARYVMKKVTGPDAEEHYSRVDPETGEIIELPPEYVTMSRRPGIGADWIKKYHSDVYPNDFVVVNGRRFKPPKYYDKFMEWYDPEMLEDCKSRREDFAEMSWENNTPERLRVREQVQTARANRLERCVK